ncbi:acetamidase/formamidase family protein [Brevibacillus sp. H7]|uniref:acetamidase/formamidase family protein n=1 Tax=Brevibacillus sp. H7 TaxID=3349138 RepID=UPI00380F4473
MTVIFKQNCIDSFSFDMEPVATVESGSEVVFETYDCYRGQLTESSSHQDHQLDGINPATGPVAVRGAEPGDVLKIEILSIQLEETGTMYLRPGSGVLKRFVEYEQVLKPVVKGNQVHLRPDLSVPLEPMIGVIGVAPAEGSVNTLVPGCHGGNLDTKEITEGAVLYLPVFQPGANLAMGDLHAAMGDGESAVCGVEIGGKVRVRIELIKGVALSQPVLEDEHFLYVIASAPTIDEACSQAAEGMFRLLQEWMPGLTANELVCLLGTAGDVCVSQLVNPQKTAKFRIPKTFLPKSILKQTR